MLSDVPYFELEESGKGFCRQLIDENNCREDEEQEMNRNDSSNKEILTNASNVTHNYSIEQRGIGKEETHQICTALQALAKESDRKLVKTMIIRIAEIEAIALLDTGATCS